MPDATPLRDIWEKAAEDWGEFAASSERDFLFWRFHLENFTELLPPPGDLTVDLGAGEGRFTAALAQAGHQVVAVDSSRAMLTQAARRPELGWILLADASRIPLRTGAASLVVAFMSLQDMDDFSGAIREAARVLLSGGRFCVALPHPIRTAGGFEGKDPRSAFTIEDSYFARRPWPWSHSHSGTPVSIPSEHRPLEAYTGALQEAGFLIETIREPAPHAETVATRPPLLRWTRIPCFLQIRAIKPAIPE